MKSLRRSLHFVPGGNRRMLEKALDLSADSLIIDLEDAVAPERKTEVREAVCKWLVNTDFGNKERLVRINPMQSPWGQDDLAALLHHPVDGIVLPKVRDLAGVDEVHKLLLTLEKRAGLQSGAIPLVLIGTEDAAAVFNVFPMATHERVEGLAWGSEDLSASLGARRKRDSEGNYLEVFSVTRSLCLLGARAAGVQPIDAVYTDINNHEGLEKECNAAADMGFTGKLTIHPSQIETVNRAFTPTEEEIKQAELLVNAFAENRRQGRQAFTFQGNMVDAAHLKNAEAVLARTKNAGNASK